MTLRSGQDPRSLHRRLHVIEATPHFDEKIRGTSLGYWQKRENQGTDSDASSRARTEAEQHLRRVYSTLCASAPLSITHTVEGRLNRHLGRSERCDIALVAPMVEIMARR